MPKKTALLTCPKMLLQEHLTELKKTLDLNTADCALNETGLIRELRGVSWLIMGGLEKITLKVLKDNQLEQIVFLGIQPETFFTKEAWQYCQDRIPVIATGGGQKAVALTTLEEITSWAKEKQILIARGLKTPPPVGEILQKTKITVIGAGKIGTMVLNGLIEHGCRVNLAYHDLARKEELDQIGLTFLPDLASAFEADIVSLHMNLVAGVNEGVIKEEYLKRIKPGGLFINNSRAELVDLQGLKQFLPARLDARVIFDPFYLEGADLENLDSKTMGCYVYILRRINFAYTGHTAAMRPETYREYGEALLRIIKERVA